MIQSRNAHLTFYGVNFMAAVYANVGLQSKKVSRTLASHPNDFSA
jgi:hypothetical protein